MGGQHVKPTGTPMTPDIAALAKGLTGAQRWAVLMIAQGRAVSPGSFGEAMMERPGAMRGRKVHYKPQGYGRMGGTMLARLERKGLAELSMIEGNSWCPTKAYLTPLGQQVAAHLKGQDNG